MERFRKVSQSNSRFDVLDTLVVTMDSVRMSVGIGKSSNKSRGRRLSVMRKRTV